MAKQKKALDKNLKPIQPNNVTGTAKATVKKGKAQSSQKEPVRKIPSSSMG